MSPGNPNDADEVSRSGVRHPPMDQAFHKASLTDDSSSYMPSQLAFDANRTVLHSQPERLDIRQRRGVPTLAAGAGRHLNGFTTVEKPNGLGMAR